MVATALYSGFGRNWSGPWDSICAYGSYWHRGSGGGEGGIHAHPWYYYFELLFACRSARGMFWTEGFIAGLAVVGWPPVLRKDDRGGIGATSRRRGRTCISCDFSRSTRSLLTALYAAIPYKTPWCALSFLHGMMLLARGRSLGPARDGPGAGRPRPSSWRCWRWRRPISGREAWLLNFRFAADARNPYAYAQRRWIWWT